MKNKLPGVYKNSNFSHVNNNKKVFYSVLNDVSQNLDYELNEEDSYVNEYIFNTPVKIETVDEVINTKIVSKVGDHILTSSNRIIKLKDIKSIKTIKI